MRKSFSIALCALLIALCSTGCSLRRKSMSGAAEADLLTSAEVAGFMDRRKPAEPFTANGSVTLRRNGEELSSRIVLNYAPDGGMVITVRPVVFFEALRIGITSEGITVIDYYGKGYLRLSEAEASRLLGVPFRSALWTALFFGLPLSGDTHKTLLPKRCIALRYKEPPTATYQLLAGETAPRSVSLAAPSAQNAYRLSVLYPNGFTPFALGNVPKAMQVELLHRDASMGSLQLITDAPRKSRATALPSLARPKGFTVLKTNDLLRLLSELE